ncbi:MAG: nucleotidyltransferase family protein [Pseudomonadota bacterium]
MILAAGTASRIGTPKQLLMFRGKPLLEHVLDNARSTRLTPLIVVLGHEANKIRHRVDFESSHVVIARNYALGQSASLKAGLSRVPSQCDGALFLLGDQPLIPSAVMNRLVECFCRWNADIVIPTYGGTRGNPVLIGRALFPQLSTLTGDTGARALFRTYPERIVEIEVGHAGICFDVDTREDYKKLCQLYPIMP